MLTFRNAIAAITMAVVALCGGGKALAEQKGTLSVSEVRAAPALRSKSAKRVDGVVAVVSTTEATTDERQSKAQAAGDDRVVSLARRFAPTPLSNAQGRKLNPPETLSESLSLRPHARAPPHSTANRLAVGSGRA